MEKDWLYKQLKGKLIVSCQALNDEPLNSSYIMGKMALAAKEGGASGIRANSPEDIEEIRNNVDLPIIGIIKRDYENSDVFITPTMREIDELMRVKPEIIAIDATSNTRPDGKSLKEFVTQIREKFPEVLLMADCSTYEEIIYADKLHFDFLGTTLVGYTKQSEHIKIEENDFQLIREVLKEVKQPLIAEGNIDTPDKVSDVLEYGVFSVVVGSAITRPKLITEKFVAATKAIRQL